MIKIPQTSEYKINNRSTIQGNILSTYNMDFYTNQGKMLVSGRGLLNIAGSSLSSALQLPVAAFKYFNNKIYAVGGYGQSATNIYYTSTVSPSSPFSVSSETSVMQKASLDNSDMSIMYSTATSNTDKLYATNDEAKIYYLPFGSTTWSNFAFGNALTPHNMCPFGNRMYVTDNFNTILSFDASHTVATLGNSYTTTLNSPVSNKLSIAWIKAAQNRLFIGAINTTGGRSAVYVWDGVQNGVFDKIIPLNSTGALSCVVLNDIPYIIDGYGILMKYNGAYFDEVGRLPMPQGLTLASATNTTNDRAVHPNGMAIINQQVHVLVNTFQDTFQPNALSGIWCYDEEIGFYHKLSASVCPYDGSANIVDSGLVSFARVGALIEARSQASITSSNTASFTGSLSVGNVSATLSSSFTGGTGLYNVYFSNGDKRVVTLTSGATTATWSTGLTSSDSSTITFDVYIQGSMLFSIQPWVGGAINLATGSQTAIFTNDTQGSFSKEGYIITPEIYASEIENVWSNFYTKYQKMVASSDNITLKYRTVVDVPVEALVTWTSAGVCTTTQDLSSFSTTGGDEIQVLSGNNAGVSGNITAISSNTAGGVTTYTVSFNNPYDVTTLSGTSRAVFTKWKLIEYYQPNNVNYKPLPASQSQYFVQAIPNIETSSNPGNADTKVQLKVICRWTGNNQSIEQIQVVEKPQVRAT